MNEDDAEIMIEEEVGTETLPINEAKKEDLTEKMKSAAGLLKSDPTLKSVDLIPGRRLIRAIGSIQKNEICRPRDLGGNFAIILA